MTWFFKFNYYIFIGVKIRGLVTSTKRRSQSDRRHFNKGKNTDFKFSENEKMLTAVADLLKSQKSKQYENFKLNELNKKEEDATKVIIF